MDKKFKNLTQELPGDGTKTEPSGRQPKEKGPTDKRTAPGHEPPQAAPPYAEACTELKEHMEQMLQNPAPTGELKRAQAALERTIILVQEHAGEDERREEAAQLTFREMGGSYFIETVEVRSAPPHRKVPPGQAGL